MASNRPPRFPQERRRPFVYSSVGLLAAETQDTQILWFLQEQLPVPCCCWSHIMWYSELLKCDSLAGDWTRAWDGVKGQVSPDSTSRSFLGWCINNERPPWVRASGCSGRWRRRCPSRSKIWWLERGRSGPSFAPPAGPAVSRRFAPLRNSTWSPRIRCPGWPQ